MFELPPLPYAYSALEQFVDEQTMHLHHDKHHAAYVKNLNAALDEHPELNRSFSRGRPLTRLILERPEAAGVHL